MGTAAAPPMIPSEDLEAAIADLSSKKEFLREAFDCLAACSTYPLPFTWEALDAHVSSVQSSISRRFRQLQVLEAARPVHIGKNQEGDIEEEEEEEVEEEEEEVVEEEEEEEEEDEKDEDEEEEEAAEEEEVEEEVVEEEEEEEEVVEEEEEEGEGEEEADKEMQDANESIGNQAKDGKEGSKNEEQAVATIVSAGQDNEAEGDAQEIDEGMTEDKEEDQDIVGVMVRKMTKKQLRRLPPGGWEDLVAACERMDAGTLVQFVICTSIAHKTELLAAMRYAPDPASLILQVVKLFLSSKKFKCSKVWGKCVSLIHWLFMESVEPSADATEHAKLVARNWKEMIGPECCGKLDFLSAWGLLHFLISYNIASEFNIHEIIRIFAMTTHKFRSNTIQICKGLGLTDRITDLIDYLIGNGQHLEVFHLSPHFNLEDKYPSVSLLKGYIEKTKQTAVEIKTCKSLNLAAQKPKEVKNLRFALHLAEQKIIDSKQRSAIKEEIKYLLGESAKNQSSACPSTASTSTWNSQHQMKKCKRSNKKCKKEEQEPHEGQDSQQQHEQNQNKLIPGSQHQLHQQENKLQATQQQQHIKWSIPATLKIQTHAVPVPLVPNVAQIQKFGHTPYAAIPGVQCYPALPGWPVAQGMSFVPLLGAPQYMGSLFNPLLPQPPFHPR